MTAGRGPTPDQVKLFCLACPATFTGAEADERLLPGTNHQVWHCPKCGSDHVDYVGRAYRRPDEGLH